jgi:predicted nucleic acid-binding protein
VVVDTSVSLPATLSPTGMARKLWVLLGYGALNHHAEWHRIELELLRAEAETLGAQAVGLQRAAVEAEATEQQRAILRDLLPDNAPEHWVALGSAVLFREYERKVREIGKRLNPNVRETDVGPLRRQLQAICAAGSPPFDPLQAPILTRDRQDDPIVYTALLAEADYLISDDRDIVPDRHEHHYEHEDHHVLAVTFNRFLAAYFEPIDLDWAAIDGRWLQHAYTAHHRAEDPETFRPMDPSVGLNPAELSPN